MPFAHIVFVSIVHTNCVSPPEIEYKIIKKTVTHTFKFNHKQNQINQIGKNIGSFKTKVSNEFV